MSPRIRGRKTSCPTRHLFPGLDVPRQDVPHQDSQDWMSPAPLQVAMEFQRGSVCATMERWSSNTITYTTMQLSVIQLNQFSKNHRHIFDASTIEHFRAEDGVVYYVCERVDLRARLSVHILSFYVDEV